MYIFFIMFQYVYSNTFSLSLGFSGLGNCIGRWSVYEMIAPNGFTEEFFFYSIEFRVAKSEFQVVKSEFRVDKSEFRVAKSEFRVDKAEFRVVKSEFRVAKSEFRVDKNEFRVAKSEFRVDKSEFRAAKSEFRVAKKRVSSCKKRVSNCKQRVSSWQERISSHYVDKKEMIRNRYSRIPHPVINTNGKGTRTTKMTLNKNNTKQKGHFFPSRWPQGYPKIKWTIS